MMPGLLRLRSRSLAKLRAKANGVASVVFKDAPFFAEDDACDEAFFFAVEERGAQSSTQGASLPRRTISMNDFEHSNAIFSGLTDFRDQAVARFLDGRHIFKILTPPIRNPNSILPER